MAKKDHRNEKINPENAKIVVRECLEFKTDVKRTIKDARFFLEHSTKLNYTECVGKTD